MNKKNQIIISAASVSAALSAIVASSADHKVLDGPKFTPYDSVALEALNTAKSQSVVHAAFPRIARTIRLDLDLGNAAYAEIAMAGGETGEGGSGADSTTSPGADEEPVEEEPAIEYNENGIPINLFDELDDSGDDGRGDNGGSDGGDFGSVEEMIAELGLQVPEGMSATDYVATLEALYAEVINQVQTLPDQATIEVINQAGSPLIDSTNAGDSYFSCYNNCHSACHGSRGWR